MRAHPCVPDACTLMQGSSRLGQPSHTSAKKLFLRVQVAAATGACALMRRTPQPHTVRPDREGTPVRLGRPTTAVDPYSSLGASGHRVCQFSLCTIAKHSLAQWSKPPALPTRGR